MAVVERPRNNLQQHLAWFNSTKPHIPPPRGDNETYTETKIPISVPTIATPAETKVRAQPAATRAWEPPPTVIAPSEVANTLRQIAQRRQSAANDGERKGMKHPIEPAFALGLEINSRKSLVNQFKDKEHNEGRQRIVC